MQFGALVAELGVIKGRFSTTRRTNGQFVSTSRWSAFSWASRRAIPNTPATCVFGTAARIASIGVEETRARTLVIGEHNVLHDTLVPLEKIILPPLHIKLGLMKQFVKALDKGGTCLTYIVRKMPAVSGQKLRAGVFDGPQIRCLINDPAFLSSMNPQEANAWRSFVLVVQNFLGNTRAANYVELVQNMLACFHALGCRMSIKVHYLNSHLDRFPQNLGAVSDEQGERFHQDIATMEERYQGRWDVHMMADYCWNLQRDCPDRPHMRQGLTRSFVGPDD